MEQLMLKPLLTEKSLTLVAFGWYTFAIDKRCTKRQIIKELESYYNVSVISVRRSNVGGKTRRVGRRMKSTRLPDWVKVRVRLKPGQTIEAFQITGESANKK